MKCQLCDNESADCIDFEVGNNAEIGIMVNLCQFHLDELEKIEYGFEKKYADKLEEIANEKLLSMADAHD